MNLSRPFKLDVCADGVVTIRGPGEPRRFAAALPVYSCETRERAALLRTTVCKLAYDGAHHLLPRALFDPDLDQPTKLGQLSAVAAVFEDMDRRLPVATIPKPGLRSVEATHD